MIDKGMVSERKYLLKGSGNACGLRNKKKKPRFYTAAVIKKRTYLRIIAEKEMLFDYGNAKK